MERELIEAVRNANVLYDTEDADYMKPELKMTIWTRIAEELHYEHGNVAKKIWEKLRNNHRDALRRQKHAKARKGVVKPWRYQKQMEFLLPHMTNRYNQVVEDSQDLDYPDDDSKDMEGAKSEDANTQEIKNQSGSTDFNSDTDEEATSIDNNDPISLEESLPKGKKTEVKKKTHIETLLKRSRLRKMAMRKKTVFDVDKSTKDPLLHFFISMYESTRKMPLTSQLRIKSNLFKVVSEEEENQLTYSAPGSTLFKVDH